VRFILALLFCFPAMGATLYCGPAGTGAGTGANFNNLLALPNTTGFVRGNTYVCIEGSYGSKTLSTATSGTTTITIRKASASDSGVTGYASSLHDGQATFGGVTINSQYWVFSGTTRNESDWDSGSAYGFRATSFTANSVSNSDDADNSIIEYCDIGGTFSDTHYSGMGEGIYMVYNQQNVTIRRCFIHNGLPAIMQLAGASGFTIEYNWIGPGWGKVAIRGGNGSEADNNIIRYNVFRNSAQTDPEDGTSGLTAEIAIWHNSNLDTASIDGNQIYGNVFYSTVTGGRNAMIVVGGNGTSWLGQSANNTLIYNNTFAGMAENPNQPGILVNGGTGNVVRNNLFYDIVGGDPGVTANTTSHNVYTASNPFVNYGSLDFHLSGATTAGTTLSSPYDTDIDGVTRGSDGTWDVGAFEFDSGGGDVTAPTMSSATIGTSGTTLTLGMDETCSIGAGGNGGVTLSASGGAVTATYSSGSGSSSLVYNLSRTINQGETVTVSYTQPGNGIEDTSGNDLATFSNSAVTNNSSQGSNPTPGVSVGSGVVFSNGVTGVK
jgi:hypothetical protein